ncbi:hypothetical protein FNF27_06853 [Cafeteria roenbergensis]|uniref:histidine kinase n=1 Tax=Cafeteria roenbergensis TaxID=33653 RepID=A0A5A8DX63_CAFRO|nr:hypothetical protein FNF27_06853 [Cafeteria roenbergensis]
MDAFAAAAASCTQLFTIMIAGAAMPSMGESVRGRFFVFSGGALATFLLFRQISGGGTTALVSQLTTDGACRYALVSGPSLSHWSTSTLVTAWYVASSISSAIARDAPGGENACRRVSLVLLGTFGVWATLPALAAYDFRLQPWAQPLLVTLMWAAGLATLLGAPVALLACSSRGERRLCARGLVMAATSNWGDMKHCARLVVAVVFLAGLSTPYWASWQWAPAPEACLPWATARWSVSGDPIPPQPQGLRHPFALDPSAPSHVESVIGGATANTSLALSALCMVFISATGLLVDASEEIADRRREVSNAAAASLGQAIAYVSHEARGPLNAAVLSLALLEDEHDQTANDALYEELSVAIHAARRHLDDLLLWERAGSPLPSAAAGGVEHAASGNSGQWSMLEATVVGAMQRDFSSLCERNGIDLQLETVLVGSLPDGSKRGSSRSLALFTSPPARAILRIEVADNGAGIPQELLESGKLFQPFARLRQGDDSLRMASSGLGLAIVRSIVVGRLRGTVGLRSRENFGTVLFANVPVWCRRRTPEDGLPAFMTLDVEMPVLDGRGVLRAMKGMDWAASGTKPPPVVVVTGNARQHDNRELTSLGAQRVLTKPVDPKVLASFLSRALSRPGVAAPGAGGPAT